MKNNLITNHFTCLANEALKIVGIFTSWSCATTTRVTSACEA